jgi:hypothetical protein
MTSEDKEREEGNVDLRPCRRSSCVLEFGGAHGSSESFATPAVAGRSPASLRSPIRLMKSGTAASSTDRIQKRCLLRTAPMGTVMSRLSRARQAFRGALNTHFEQSGLSR